MQATMEGKQVPKVTFRSRRDGEWVNIDSEKLFNGRNVVVFSLPGAFTPTCSSSHLPRYNELASVFKANGIDEIVCMSVNDGFVMEAWGRDQDARNLTLLPDGNGEFTNGMGMLVEKNDLGFGSRSWRYSMLVRDGVVEKMFVEPDKPGDPFEVSDADTMLKHLSPDAEAPQAVTMFSRAGCPHCARAKKALDEAGYVYEEIPLGGKLTNRSLAAVAGATTTPQVFIGGQRIGSADELEQWLQHGSRAAA